ncbi:pyruvate oxidase [Companilactobacillus alimentarius]|uniref:Pyruvate oxidase n=1 Tax=Companilactobacillus alimentarius DSM 20249 TaxID=1423720 RepID=A0A2K9HJE0_9LACO|nr:pyruvate oxidase [Companilactobacillus alimentarius]AUI72498.1 pyruvate oxidase [Companilactobacillus alimentarius DSM 20249]KRK77734.1 pyruvate oxidase [Companilactobacillus alimentarius DSM 20249]MDT6953086.1 pyruvate oxidase [Companilactobacillus alimentarius]GEO45029.1 pyruvate oxidase [Companilactobacillus alimentarius]
MSVRASDKMIEVLEKWGVNNIYGLPGDSVDTTIDALYRAQDKIKFTHVLHEEVAALAASAHAKLTGKLGVCLSIGGPGAIHLLNGLYDAKMDHAPVLAILGQVQSKLLNTDFFQEVDTHVLFDDVAVYNKIIMDPQSLPRIADEAIRTAIAKKGVAVLTIPDDIPAHMIKDNFTPSVDKFKLDDYKVDDDKIKAALEMMKIHSNPIVLAGVGIKNAKAETKEFIEKYKLPIILTMPAKGLVDDDHPYNLGQLGKLGTKPAFEMMQKADLVIMLGTDYPYAPYLNKKVDAIQVDINADRIGKRRHINLAIQGDTKEVLSRLNALGEPVKERHFLDLAVSKMGQWRSWMHDVYTKKHEGVLPSLMFHNISKSAPSDTVWSIDVGTSTAFGARFLTAKSSQMYTISAWLGTMGCALPGAIAAKMDMPDRPVYAIAGDGAFSMVMQDFATAVRYNLPMLFVVLNNKLLAFIEYEQQSAGQQNYGISLPSIDFAKFAEACGGIGERITTDKEFSEAIEKYRNPEKPVLLDVAVNDEAPLPGKIMMDEAHGYAKFGLGHVIDKKSLPELPPMKEILRSFL